MLAEVLKGSSHSATFDTTVVCEARQIHLVFKQSHALLSFIRFVFRPQAHREIHPDCCENVVLLTHHRTHQPPHHF